LKTLIFGVTLQMTIHLNEYCTYPSNTIQQDVQKALKLAGIML